MFDKFIYIYGDLLHGSEDNFLSAGSAEFMAAVASHKDILPAAFIHAD